MSDKKVKAVKKYATYTEDGDILSDGKMLSDSAPVYVLPATPEAYEHMVEQIHEAIYKDEDLSQSIAHHQWLDLATLALAAIGITQPKKNK